MKIQYLGHSCFRIISEMGNTVVCDPYNGNMTGYAMPYLSCDVATLSHHHGDHNFVQGLKGEPCIIDSVVSCCADDIAIESFECNHDDKDGAKRGKNLVFTFSADGIRVAHMGDVGEQSQIVADRLSGVDVLLVPVGGTYTIDCNGAKWYIDQIKPSLVIPMHYLPQDGSLDIAPLDDFLQLFDHNSVKVLDSETITLDDKPDSAQPQVVVLQRYKE